MDCRAARWGGEGGASAIPSNKKCPAEAGHKWGNGMRIQTAQSFERQGRRPSALGHDGRWSWIFAKRSLADRGLSLPDAMRNENKRTGCLQSNVNFLQRLVTRNA